jgi:hypothetical protein
MRGSRFMVPFFALRATQGRQGSWFKGSKIKGCYEKANIEYRIMNVEERNSIYIQK